MLAETLHVLRWKSAQEGVFEQVERAYTSLAAGSLGSSLAECARGNPRQAEHIIGLMTEMDADHLRQVLLAPESASRLLWGHPGACDERDVWSYLVDVLEVEAALATPMAGRTANLSTPRRRWSALGDFCVNDSGAAVIWQRPLAGLAIDSESPFAVCFNCSSVRNGSMRLEHFADGPGKDLALERIRTAMLAIEAADPQVAGFVRRFTLIAHVVVDSGTDKFSSGSSGEYTGRSILCNAHLPGVSIEVLAEALVHEAIHSFLYMQEACHAWVSDEEQCSDEAVVRSPWSGAMLPLRNFLQACFVWFGLAHFWMRAPQGRPFERNRLEARLETARQGFLAGRLLNRISEFLPSIAPRVLDLVDAMQENIAGISLTRDAAGSEDRPIPLQTGAPPEDPASGILHPAGPVGRRHG